MDKGEQLLPPYSAVADPPASLWTHHHGPRGFHGLRRRGRLLRLAGLACLLYIGYAQWTQLRREVPVPGGPRSPDRHEPPPVASLSLEKLQTDVATCAALHSTPSDAEGAGRSVNARHVAGQRPTLIRNATVWVGEPEAGTTPEQARAGKGFRWVTADVLLEHGLIQRVAPLISISLDAVPASAVVWDARGRQLTAGIIDMHSHAGVGSLPELDGNQDINEMSSDITPYVRSIDAIQPQDHQIQVIKSGGVTTSLVLPGSGNNIGGEAYVIKHAVGRHDGRPELSIASLLAAPDAPGLRYIKMACGENAKRIYGKLGERGPYSRLGESWAFRHAFEQAAALVQAQDDWCAAAEPAAAAAALSSNATLLHGAVPGYLPRDLEWDTLAAVLRGQVRVNTHCYTVPDLEAFVDHTNEFRFPVWAFHHAHQTFLVPEVLRRAWGADRFGPPASAMFADNMYYKAEAYVASEFAGKILYDNGLTPIYVSDNPVLNAQHVLFEAAKAYHYGLPYHAALAAVTTAPAERLGLGRRLGRVKPGFDADIVVWDSDPLSVGAAPVQVWIDGVVQFDDPVELDKPVRPPFVPDETLARKSDEVPVDVGGDVVFTGVAKVLLPGFEEKEEEQKEQKEQEAAQASSAGLNVAVSGGRVTCVGACSEQLRVARDGKSRVVSLQNGYLTAAFTAFGSNLGLVEIDAERTTDNGPSGDVFSRAIDGLALGGKKLAVALRYGVTRAVSAPKLRSAGTHYGTSAGFLTGGGPTALDEGVVFASDAAVHYTLGQAGKQAGGTPSLSSAVGALRNKLLKAVAASSSSSSSSAARPTPPRLCSTTATRRQPCRTCCPSASSWPPASPLWPCSTSSSGSTTGRSSTCARPCRPARPCPSRATSAPAPRTAS